MNALRAYRDHRGGWLVIVRDKGTAKGGADDELAAPWRVQSRGEDAFMIRY